MSKHFCGRCNSWIEGTYLEHDEKECELLQLEDRASQVEGLKVRIAELESENDGLEEEIQELTEKLTEKLNAR